ncbi:MAG TPA: methyltransferase domain-containing protein [Rectinemataceae bacterium]|nr:methyltransferase domain-containing protein [Rectinemataceae bacterium]
MHQKFDPRHRERLDSPERRLLLPPEEILGRFGLATGETVLDIGAGVGFFSIPAAKLVGPEGRVLAIDSSPEMAAELGRRVEAAGLGNLAAGLSREYEFGVESATVDLALLCTVLHEVEDKQRLLGEVRRCLKKGGRLGLVEWQPSHVGHGPHAGARLKPELSRDLVEEVGLTVDWVADLNESVYLLQARA